MHENGYSDHVDCLTSTLLDESNSLLDQGIDQFKSESKLMMWERSTGSLES